jgi:hypothetical protein
MLLVCGGIGFQQRSYYRWVQEAQIQQILCLADEYTGAPLVFMLTDR